MLGNLWLQYSMKIMIENKSRGNIIKLLKQMSNLPGITLAIMFISTIVTFLILGIYLLLVNFESLGNRWNEQAKIFLVPKNNLSPETLSKFHEKLSTNTLIANATLFKKEAALAILDRHQLANGLAINCKKNLPTSTIILTLKIKNLTKNKLNDLTDELKRCVEIEKITADIPILQEYLDLFSLCYQLTLLIFWFLVFIWSLNTFGSSYILSKLLERKVNGSKDFLATQCSIYALIGSTLAFSLVRIIVSALNNRGIYFDNFNIFEGTCFLILAATMAYIGSRTATINNASR